MELFTYFRSSAAYRVRIALNYKGVAHTLTPVNLLKAEHRSESYLADNPQGLVPYFKTDDGAVISQSTAILEWIEATQGGPALLPEDPLAVAQNRAWSNIIACDIHPIDNLRVLKYLTGELDISEEQKTAWYKHWIELGFETLENQLSGTPYSAGEQVSLVDCYLVPQVYNALRFKVDMNRFPKILSIYNSCNELDAFKQAHPDNQPDNPENQ